MKHIKVIKYLCIGALLCVESGLLHAEETPKYTCTSYTATADLVKINAAGQRYIDAKTATKDSQYAKICFKDNGTANLTLNTYDGSQLLINNTLDVPLYIENLRVQQDATPPGSSIILTGAPIILRNAKVTNTNGQSLVDGVEVRTSQVTIEHATVENFRYGLVVPESAGANQLTITKGVFRRTSALTGSAGIHIKSGHGQTITDVTVQCSETGLALTGGTSDAPNVVQGGTFSGKPAAGASCNSHAGLFLQGGYVSANSTTEHPLTSSNHQFGVILDPQSGPIGIDGGTVVQSAIGVKITGNAVVGSQLQLGPLVFNDVITMCFSEKPIAESLQTVQLAKQCEDTVDILQNEIYSQVCDGESTENAAVNVVGTLPDLYCESKSNRVLLYVDSNFFANQSSGKSMPSFIGSCTVQPFAKAMTFLSDETESPLKVAQGSCGFQCNQSLDGNPFSVPLAASVVWPVLVTENGAYPIEEGLQVASLSDWVATPGVAMATPIGGAPGVTGGDGDDGGALDQLTGGDAGTNLGEGDLGGGNNGTVDAENAGGAGTAPGNTHAPFDDETIVPDDGTLDGRGSQIIAGGSLGGGSSEGAPGVAGGGAAGCSLIIQQ